jgi:hypothetical protein
MYRITGAIVLAIGLVFASIVPASAASTNRYCTANDPGYRLQLAVEYNKTSAGTDITKVSALYGHRTLGVWGASDWADTQYTTIRRNGSNYKTFAEDPAGLYLVVTNTPRLTGSLSISVTAVGDDAVVNNCILNIP